MIIQHAKNGGEKKITLTENRIVRVDGYCEETNTVFEFHGCFYHGHDPLLCKGKHKFEAADINPKTGVAYGELYRKTMERDKAIRASGYTLFVVWECEYIELKHLL
jgi:G:T-mismatch repair DNA endonuclease (very short patch repair protein)